MKSFFRQIPRPSLITVIILLTAATLLACGPAAQSAPVSNPLHSRLPSPPNPHPRTLRSLPIPRNPPPGAHAHLSPSAYQGGPNARPSRHSLPPRRRYLYTGNFYYKGTGNLESHLICYQLLTDNLFIVDYTQELPSLRAFWSEMQQTVAQDHAVATAH